MSRRGFTLVEMLVVIGIIGVLAALLLPAVMMAINAARRARIGTEIAELNKAVESYRDKHDDYPPNFRDYDAFLRHVRKCYRSIDSVHLNNVVATVWTGFNLASPPPPGTVPNIDEGESLVFWLYLVDNDNRAPFKALLVTTNLPDTLLAAQSPEKLFPFDETRLVDGADADYVPSYKAIYSGDTAYIYIDSRSYLELTVIPYTTARAAFAEDPTAGYIRPYWSEGRANSGALTPPDLRDDFKPMNPTSFQIICAGQDGLFQSDPEPTVLKFFPGGGGYSTLNGEDNDNMTNFSDGSRLEDKIP